MSTGTLNTYIKQPWILSNQQSMKNLQFKVNIRQHELGKWPTIMISFVRGWYDMHVYDRSYETYIK